MEQNNIKKIAYERISNDPIWQLRTWWSCTYNKPIIYNSLDEYTDEELLLEFYMYKFYNDATYKKDYEQESGIVAPQEKDDEEWIKKMEEKDRQDMSQDDDEVNIEFR